MFCVVVFVFVGCNSQLSKEDFDRVKSGMTADQVVEILGKPKSKTETDTPFGKAAIWNYPGSSKDKPVMIMLFDNKVSQRVWQE